MSRTIRPVPSRPEHRHRVSVVVPSYNYGRFLKGCVESALNQPGVDVDVLIVDNASEDDSQAVASALAAADSRVSVIFHDRNLGHITSFNEGLWSVDGEYVVLLCADDMLPPGSLERAVAMLEAHSSIGFVYGRPVELGDVRPLSVHLTAKSWTVWPGREWLALRCRHGLNCVYNPEVVMRASTLRSVGGFRPEVPAQCDFEMWMRIASVSDVGRINGTHQGWYREHAQSLTQTTYPSKLVSLEQRRDAFALVFEGPGRLLPNGDALHASARRGLATEALDRACRAYDRGLAAEVPIDALVGFACDLWPEATQSPKWRKLARRRRVNFRHAKLLPPFVVSAAVRRASEELKLAVWRRSGV